MAETLCQRGPHAFTPLLLGVGPVADHDYPLVWEVTAPRPWRARSLRIDSCSQPGCTECADLPPIWLTFIGDGGLWLCVRATMDLPPNILLFGLADGEQYRDALGEAGHTWDEILEDPAGRSREHARQLIASDTPTATCLQGLVRA